MSSGLQIMRTKVFDKSLGELVSRGGNYARAADQVLKVLGQANYGDPFKGLSTTNHGENRIKKCTKYHLNKFCRLIVVRKGNTVFLCFTGTHKACDKWLDENRGFVIKTDDSNSPVITFESEDIQEPAARLKGPNKGFRTRLLEALPKTAIQDLLAGLDSKMEASLLDISSLTDDDEILSLISPISSDQQTAIFDALMLLREGKLQEAERGVLSFLGKLKPIPDVEKTGQEFRDSEDWQKLLASDQYRKLIEHYSRTANFQDWMLFMHPDQESYVQQEFSGPAKLIGVSGSGKTCVVVKRAIRLASEREGKVLVLTLNRSLANMIQSLVETAASSKVFERIEVLPLFTLCQRLLQHFEPDNQRLYDDRTWKSLEHIDEVWREFYRCELNNSDASVLSPVHDSLIGRGIDAESYLREEFDWIRSALPPEGRSHYLGIKRTGRSYPLDANFRKPILHGLEYWEKKMLHVGVSDYLGLSAAVYKHLDKIIPEYDCILVDESQDFGTIELAIVRKLAAYNKNDFFLCGDAAQKVSSKHQDLKQADVKVPSTNSKKLTRNYRNSREILNAAFDVLFENLTEEIIDSKDFDVLDPEQGYFNGPVPFILEGTSLEHEIGAALELLKTEVATDGNFKGCLVICGFTLHELKRFGDKLKLPVLDGTRGIEEGDIFISDLENTKGFEFQYVCIVNCSSAVIPDPACPRVEQFRDLSRLYVAMTRARHQLIISHTGEKSAFLSKTTHFLEESWEDYQSNSPADVESFGIPQRLEEFREIDEIPYEEMSGPQFLYTETAIGRESLLIEKLRNQVPGVRKVKGGNAVEWKCLGDASKDVKRNPVSRNAFGKKGIELFRGLLSELEIER